MEQQVIDRLHNRPPSDVEILRDRLSSKYDGTVSRRDDLLAAFARAPETIEDDAVCGRVGDFTKQIAATIKSAEAERVNEKEPHLSAGKAVDAFFASINDPLDKARKALLARVTTYERVKADSQRRAREEEARRVAAEAERVRLEADAALAKLDEAADAATADIALDDAVRADEQLKQATADVLTAQRAADVKPAELSRVRGEYGSVSSLRQFWDFADLDRETLDLDALRSHIPLDAMEKAVRSFIKAGGRNLRGVRIFENTSAVIR